MWIDFYIYIYIYIYMAIYTLIHTHTYIYTYMNSYIYINAYTHRPIHTQRSIYIYIYTHTHRYIHIYREKDRLLLSPVIATDSLKGQPVDMPHIRRKWERVLPRQTLSHVCCMLKSAGITVWIEKSLIGWKKACDKDGLLYAKNINQTESLSKFLRRRSIKNVVRISMKVPEFDKHQKKAGGHIGWNIVEITIKMKTIVRKPLMIKDRKLVGENLQRGTMQQLADLNIAQWLRNIRRCFMERKEPWRFIMGATYYRNIDHKRKQQDTLWKLKVRNIACFSVKSQKGKRKKR